jgi:group II intron reverse transcriptase/maturase
MSAPRASDLWSRISSTSRDRYEGAVKNLFHLFNRDNLLQGFKALDGSKAHGIDNVSKKEYGKALDSNIEKLLTKLHNGSYVPSPKREVLIPKANGKKRPIAIACTEDKVVEKLTANLLTCIYEKIFLHCSYGFRPNLSCHHAIKQAHTILDSKKEFNHVVEIDLSNFFNTVNHRLLMQLVRIKIGSNKLLSLIHRQLVAKIETESGDLVTPDVGTPQGGIVSPILANVFLHYAVDEWFSENYREKAEMVRYADDAVFFFKKKEEAESFLESLKARLRKFKLQLNEEKTRIIDMSKDSFEVFDFLGFTFYRGRERKVRGRLLMVKTSKTKLHKAMDDFRDWIKKERNAKKTKDLLKEVNAKLRGHYNYFGYWCNRNNLYRYYCEVSKMLFKWLNRRSQKKSFNCEKFKRIIVDKLLQPPEIIGLKQLGRNPYANIY